MLKVNNLNFSVGNFQLKDINCEVSEKEYFILLGPTGCGKTTLIKCIAGLNKPTSGNILINHTEVTGYSPELRNIGYVPQHYGLFPHLNVEENITFGLKIKKFPLSKIEKRLKKITEILEIEWLLHRNVDNLSGGEKQKVALARALIVKPEILLLDEPFSSIDEGFRKNLWFRIKNILKELKIPVIHITHNLTEAQAVGEKIGIMFNGQLSQVEQKENLFERPKTLDIANFLGYRNIYEGTINESHDCYVKFRTKNFAIIAKTFKKLHKGEKVSVCIPEHGIKIIKKNFPIRDELKDNVFTGKIVDSIIYANFATIFFQINNSVSTFDFEASFPSYIYKRHKLKIAKTITVAIWQPQIMLFDSSGKILD